MWGDGSVPKDKNEELCDSRIPFSFLALVTLKTSRLDVSSNVCVLRKRQEKDKKKVNCTNASSFSVSAEQTSDPCCGKKHQKN